MGPDSFISTARPENPDSEKFFHPATPGSSEGAHRDIDPDETQRFIGHVLKKAMQTDGIDEFLEWVLAEAATLSWLNLQKPSSIFLSERFGKTMERLKSAPLKEGEGPCCGKGDECWAVSPGTCFCGIAALTGKPITGSSSDTVHPPLPPDAKEHFHICIPIIFNDEMLGILKLQSGLPFAPKGPEIDFLTVLADTLAMVVSRKREHTKLQESSIFTRRIIDGMMDLFFVLDPDGRIVDTNRSACSYLGCSESELKGRSFSELVPLMTPAEIAALNATARNEDKSNISPDFKIREETYLCGEGGEMLPVELKFCGIHGENRTDVVVMASDITDRKLREISVRKAQTEAEEANRAKSMFLASVGHEIRTPMNAVVGMSSLLMDTTLDPRQRRYVESIRSSADSLLGIIEQVLDFSKMEAGRFKLTDKTFDLTRVVNQAMDAVIVQAESKKIALETRISSDIPKVLTGDPERLKQVLINLLGNAVKFTFSGNICLEAGWEWTSEEKACLHFCVRDTGIGIPFEYKRKIFEPFEQVSGTKAITHGGTGLGLRICFSIVSAMEGKIWAESPVSEDLERPGSAFHFTAVFGIGESSVGIDTKSMVLAAGDSFPGTGYEPPARAPEAHESEKLRVLLVEDNEINRIVSREMLLKLGHEVVTAENGSDGLDRYRDSRFDLVVMDARMPLMDGFEASRAIRNHEAAHGLERTPILLLSADVMDKGRDALESSGIDICVVKPIRISRLASIIEELTGEIGKAGNADVSPSGGQKKNGVKAPAKQSVDKKSENLLPESFPPIDLDEAVDICGGDESLLRVCFKEFLDTQRNSMRDIRVSLAVEDSGSLAASAHRLKGGLLSIAAGAGAEYARRIEKFGKNSDFPAARKVLTDLEEEMHQLADFIDNYLLN